MPKTRPLVIVDPGHGGKDPGADAYLVESEINLDLATLFAVRAHDFDTLLTRKGDQFVSLGDRAMFSNVHDADAFLSFHCNAAVDPEANGFEVWTSPGDTAADPLATRIFAALADACPGMPGRRDMSDGDPDKESPFYVLRHTTAPAVLIEFGFVTNERDALFLDDVENQLRIVEAVSGAVDAWLKERT